ncbi:hypothetical protein DFP73DRAFT_535026 [Morchella snyderi]|nr:hypothetical protein DFP73DRAFT_535026 [Morchella snyderi]
MDGHPKYRSTKPVPYNLNERIRGALEESLYAQAIECLGGVISPGVSTPSLSAALIPPHTHIRLITTLVSHPYLTSQLPKNEPTPTAPIDAFLLLRRVLKLIGPLNSNFAAAWVFEDTRVRGRRTKKERDRDNSPAANTTTDDHLAGDLAEGESLFAVAEDVWAIVGWGFTCSVIHPTRWKWWKLQLEILLDVLEADWEDRQATCAQTSNSDALKNALFVKMLPDTKGSAGYKKVIRAILANGTGSNLDRCNPIYKDELSTKRPKKNNMGSLNSSFVDDDQNEPETTTSTRSKSPSEDTEMTDDPSNIEDDDTGVACEWGGMEALVLRQRFLSLLSSVSYRCCYIDINDLYREYKDIILRFSPSSFMLFTSTFISTQPNYRAALNQLILDTIISSKAPMPKRNETDDLTTEKLMNRYLPWPANTTSVSDNAKVAMLLESMTRLLVTEAGLVWSTELELAVEKGIEERRKKATGDRRINKEKEKEARLALEDADGRLRAMIAFLKQRADK